jgi:hypothetical protein
MWRRTAICTLLAGLFADGTAAEAQVLLGFIGSDSRFAVQGTVEGAAHRLSRASCQGVLSDFADQSGEDFRTKLRAEGRSPVEAFSALRFVDNPKAPQCVGGTILAFTQPGSTVIHVCGRQFMKRSRRNRMTAEIIMIHEFLHTLGLGENPPTSQAITEQVTLRCGG